MRIFLLAIVMCFSVIASATTLNKVVVFGDSLSDNGNLYEYMKHQFPLSPPYYQGRMTNGPVWVESLVQSLFPNDGKTRLVDYAYAGASVEELNDDEPLFTLHSEIDSYFLAHQNKAEENSLFVLWIGANNYLALPEDAEQATRIVTDGIKRNLKRLADKGAKHILILNLPDLGRTPVAHDFDAPAALTDLSNRHNQLLLENIESLKALYPDVQWMHFDVRGALDEMLMNPEINGFTNVTQSCLDTAANQQPSLHSSLSIAARVNVHKGKDVDCDGYLFFDPVHPSVLAHQILAERTGRLLLDSGINFGG